MNVKPILIVTIAETNFPFWIGSKMGNVWAALVGRVANSNLLPIVGRDKFLFRKKFGQQGSTLGLKGQ